MKIIKIDKKSIKINKYAGRTSIPVFGATELEFKFNGVLPEWLKDGEDGCHFLNVGYSSNGVSNIDGVFDFQSNTFLKLQTTNGASTTMKRDCKFEYLIRPIPKYSFEYTNPLIKCEKCGKSTRLKNIETIYQDDDDYYSYTECGKCHELDSFEPFEYEKIESLNLK